MENGIAKPNITAGVIAHVDAGKTTLCEAMLYLTGCIRKLGRVDHRDCALDTGSLERERGITIFSKQAVLPLKDITLTLLDTPGHTDFSAETERAVSVMDCAVLVISGTDGVQAHTETVWKLLEHYGVPCFLFVTKMDLPTCDRAAVMKSLKERLSPSCTDMTEAADLGEELALCRDDMTEKYLETGEITDEDISSMIATRSLFPCFFGSGLRTDGVEDFLDFLNSHVRAPLYPEAFSAAVYKIMRDAQGNLLTCLKVTGGSLSVRDSVTYRDRDGTEHTEKISRISVYEGTKPVPAETAAAGTVAAVSGLTAAWPGLGLGDAAAAAEPVLEPVLQYRVVLPQGADPVVVLPKLLQLDAEAPELHIEGDAQRGIITVRLMGRVQEEIFRSLVKERFDLDVTLDAGHILYRETIGNTVEGVGHFEPLRHYAEVHLLMEPLPRGSGIRLQSSCSEDDLDRNWQRLILTHLAERTHRGVLTGSPLTDVRITLAAGRAHLKHTEGGDFREATYRAVRQGLMQADNILLEPWYRFVLEVPSDQIGRAITDIRAMGGSFSSPELRGGMNILEGICPVSSMSGYQTEVISYSHGRGRLSCVPDGYRPCHNADEVIAAAGYDPEADLMNPADSVFCAHGSGFNVKWNKVPEYMHLESCLRKPEAAPVPAVHRSTSIDDRELEAIMEREFGPIRRKEYSTGARVAAAPAEERPFIKRKEHLIVDGYNVIFAWPELKALASGRLDLARGRLMDILSSYCGYTKDELVLVFDAYRTPGNPGSRSDYHNIHVVYTKDGETADRYIETLAGEIGKNYSVRVITNDTLIRVGVMRSGVLRTSSDQFLEEVSLVQQQIDSVVRKSSEGAHTTKLKDGIQQ